MRALRDLVLGWLCLAVLALVLLFLWVGRANAQWMVTLKDTSGVTLKSFRDRVEGLHGSTGGYGIILRVNGISDSVLRQMPEVRRDTVWLDKRVNGKRVIERVVIYVDPDGFDRGGELSGNSGELVPYSIDQSIRTAWALGARGQGQTIALLGTGVDTTHQEFHHNGASRTVFCVNYGSGGDPADCTDNLPACNGHETHTSGTALGETVGVAPAATLHVLKTSIVQGGACGNLTSNWTAALLSLTWASSPKIASISFSGTTLNSTAQNVVAQYLAAGGILVTSSGNGGGLIQYPAAYPSTISVGSVDQSRNKAASSSYLPNPNPLLLSGYGVGIESASPGGGYAVKNGTSMAAPWVAGLVAIIQGERQRQGKAPLVQNEMAATLCSQPDPTNPPDQTGCGLPRIDRIVAQMRGGIATSLDTVRTYQTAAGLQSDCAPVVSLTPRVARSTVPWVIVTDSIPVAHAPSTVPTVCWTIDPSKYTGGPVVAQLTIGVP